jgi:hypothetical protein
VRVLALLCTLGFAAIPISAAGSGAPQPDGPERLSLQIDPGQVVTKDFLGFGVELDPMALNANNRRRGVTDEDWRLLTDRLAEMRMPIVRMMSQLGWFAAAGPNRFDYDNPQARSLMAYLDFCQKHDIDVILTDWAWVGQCKWVKGHDDPAYAQGIATYLKHLLEDRKYSCIKFLVIGNEPDNEIKDVERYARMYCNVHEALKAAGLRDKVRLMGPDIGGQWEWFDRAAARIAGVVDAYDFHRYAEQAEVCDDGQKMLLRNLMRFRPVVDRVDPDGKDKPILMTEMGMAGGGTNAHHAIDTFDYALHMGDYAIGVLNSGAKAGIAWCAFDVYYFEGDQFMIWGMWKYKDQGWKPKPWHSVWQEVTRSVPRHSDVVAVEGVQGAVHAAAIAFNRSAGEGKRGATYWQFTVLLANRSSGEKSVSVALPAGQAGRWRKTSCTSAGVERTDPADLPTVARKARLDLALPAQSFTVVNLDFPVPTK